MAEDYRNLFAEQGRRWQAETTLTTTTRAALDAYAELVEAQLRDLDLGAPVGGFLGDALGYRAMLWTAAAGFLIVSATFAASRFRTARIDEATATQTYDLRALRFRPPNPQQP
jgi:hypothetical protein